MNKMRKQKNYSINLDANALRISVISVLSNLLILMSTGPINHWQVSCLPQPALVVVGLLAHSNKL